ncbi:MAG: MFS transporter [Burkholderiaceae bacterium]
MDASRQPNPDSATQAAALPPALRRRGLAAVFGSTFIELTGYFMLVPLLVVTLTQRGVEAGLVGLFSAAGWFGICAATPFTAAWVERLGKRGALIVSAAIPAVCMTGIVLTNSLLLWSALYLISGMASALRWIVAEATVAELAPAARRGRIVGLFETMIGATFVLGPALLALTGTAGRAPFLIALALVILGFALSFLVPHLPHEKSGDARHLGFSGVWLALKSAPVVMIAGFVGGFFESGITGLLPVWGLALGFGVAAATLLVSASGLGSSLMMIPIGEAADRFPRRAVFLTCAWVTLAGTLLLPLARETTWLAWLIAFVWGGAGGALYTLSMIEIGHRHQNTQLMNATAVLVMAYTAGGMVAPVVGGFALQLSPVLGFPVLMAAVALAGLLALAFGLREKS